MLILDTLAEIVRHCSAKPNCMVTQISQLFWFNTCGSTIDREERGACAWHDIALIGVVSLATEAEPPVGHRDRWLLCCCLHSRPCGSLSCFIYWLLFGESNVKHLHSLQFGLAGADSMASLGIHKLALVSFDSIHLFSTEIHPHVAFLLLLGGTFILKISHFSTTIPSCSLFLAAEL